LAGQYRPDRFRPELDIYDRSWPIWTYSEIVPPAKFIHDEEGRRGAAISSLIAGGCIISGSEVKNRCSSPASGQFLFGSITGRALPYVTVNRRAAEELRGRPRRRHPEGLVVGEDPGGGREVVPRQR
jgi:glucose-1-phosphate adenylyltransferase